MKDSLFYLTLLSLILSVSCSERKAESPIKANVEVITSLPFMEIDLKEMKAFKADADNWNIVGGVYADRNQDKVLHVEEGIGVLVNIPEEGKKENLYSLFEHGDMELELDVMMPKGSNSGLYFQSRYEVQLFDSWGVKEPKHADMGGIYQRWNETKAEGEEGFEGFAPRTNAAKSPGLWQHLKVIFHAPKFDASGNKVKNAWFEEVWLNGALIHQDIALSGPTRSGAGSDEISKAPLMIQGDHGPVALKNIQYKLYTDQAIGFKNLKLTTYENAAKQFPNLDSLNVLNETEVEAIELTTIANDNSQKIFKYTGEMAIPDSGNYLFDLKVDGGAALLINKDTLVSMNGNYNKDSLGLGKISLEKGDVPFTLIYNKHTPWRRYFNVYVEGPKIQKYSLQKVVQPERIQEIKQDFSIKVENEPVVQRSFWMHEGEKRTHCIAVGMPQGTHYTYDLETGSLLQVWGGDFMDATKMWLSRGEKQLGAPMGFIVSLHGDPEFAFLENKDADWPHNSIENPQFRQKGYEFDSNGIPTFLAQINGSNVTNTLIPSDDERALKRIITVDATTDLWYKIADGERIEELPDGTFIVNNESYYIDFDGNSNLKPIVRNSSGKDELLVKIKTGKQKFNYNIIW